jgi:hypothetical protein
MQKTGVPYLSSIPILGKLFSYESPTSSKTEVIIVITPTIVSENDRVAKIDYPKDSELFNHRNDKLFRDGYRLTAEDLIPLNTIYSNQRFIDYKKIANELQKSGSKLATQQPFVQWTGDKVPGEEIYARRAVTHIISRLQVADPVPLDQLIILEKSDSLGFKKTSLSEILKSYGASAKPEGFFTANPKKALVITYDLAKNSDGYIDVRSESVPEISLVDCEDSRESLKLLWNLNKPRPDGENTKISIVIKDPEDLNLIKASNIANIAISINGGNEALKLSRYSQGRMIQMPIVAVRQERPIVASVAKNFYYSKLYMQAFDTNFDYQLDVFKNAMGVAAK